MATVLDAFFITIGLDPSGMQKGAADAGKAQDKIQKDAKSSSGAVKQSEKEQAQAIKDKSDAEVKARKDAEAAAKKAAEGISKLRNEVLGLISSFVGLVALKDFGSELIGINTQAARSAGTLGIAADSLKYWQSVASNFGASAEEVNSAFSSMNQFQDELSRGSPEAAKQLADLGNELAGINARAGTHVQADFGKLSDKNLSAEERLLELSKTASQLSEKDSILWLAKAGISANVAKALHSGNVELAKSLQYAKDIDKDAQKAADSSLKISKAWIDIKNRIIGVGDSILVNVAPAIDNVQSVMIGFLDVAKNHTGAVTAAVGALSIALGAIQLNSLVSLAAKFGLASTGAARLIGLLGSAGLVAAAGAAGYAIGALINDQIDNMLRKFPEAITWIDSFLNKLLGVKAPDISNKPIPISIKVAAANRVKSNVDLEKVNLRSDKSALKAEADKEMTQARNDAGVSSPQTNSLANLISRGEGDYNSVNRGEAGGNKAGKENLEAMTIADVLAAQKEKKFNAAGRYQIIPSTLKDAIANLNLNVNDKFDKSTQDKIFKDYLIGIKRKEVADYQSGKSNDLHAAVKAISEEWASVADPDTGKSHYAGVGNNKASISSEEVANVLKRSRTATLQPGSPVDPAITKALQPGAPVDKGLNVGAAAAVSTAQTTTNNNSQANNTAHVENNIGTINVNAPNAKTNGDVGSAIGANLKSMQNYVFASNANTGLGG